MKIDKRDCPILFGGPISLRSLGITKYINGNEIPNELLKSNEVLLNECLSNIMFITHGVVMAFDSGPQETFDKLMGLRNEIGTVSRCVIWKEGGATTTTLYSFDEQDGRTTFIMLWQISARSMPQPITFLVAGYWDHDWSHDRDECNKFAIGGSCSHPSTITYWNTAAINQCQVIVQCEVFLQYAELETKILNSNQKDSILCKYNNKLPFKITIVDSTWYTELIKSDAFKVRGHFRLQPFGNGMKKRKLVWINEFQKNGYHRLAKKLHEVA